MLQSFADEDFQPVLTRKKMTSRFNRNAYSFYLE